MQFRIQRHGTIESTSETAFEALAAGTARHGDVHVAEAQTRGRGRLGRRWHSAPGEGLYMSVVLLPRSVLSPAGLTIAAGLAVLDAVSGLGLAGARLKWPNDVIVPTRDGDAKLAGILVETRGLDALHPHYVVGIGVNVAQASFPAELMAERPVASLKTCGLAVDVATLLEALLPRLGARVEQITSDPRRLARDFANATGLAGARVVVVAGDREHAGRLESIEVDTGLELLTAGGERTRFALEIVREIRVP
jgi:BirA family biotin operon repressor/biotin-[acetyl-CoA-carboxylase] ligase